MMQDIETLLKTWPDFNLKPLHAAKVAGWELWATSFDTLTCARIPLVLISVTEGTWGMKALSDYFEEYLNNWQFWQYPEGGRWHMQYSRIAQMQKGPLRNTADSHKKLTCPHT